jgi:hypothetical protein
VVVELGNKGYKPMATSEQTSGPSHDNDIFQHFIAEQKNIYMSQTNPIINLLTKNQNQINYLNLQPPQSSSPVQDQPRIHSTHLKKIQIQVTEGCGRRTP